MVIAGNIDYDVTGKELSKLIAYINEKE